MGSRVWLNALPQYDTVGESVQTCLPQSGGVSWRAAEGAVFPSPFCLASALESSLEQRRLASGINSAG